MHLYMYEIKYILSFVIYKMVSFFQKKIKSHKLPLRESLLFKTFLNVQERSRKRSRILN